MVTLGDIVAATAKAHAGQKWILAIGVSAAVKGFVATLQEWGDDGVMLVSAAAGVGETPDVPTHYTGSVGTSIMGGIRSFHRSIVEPDEATQAAVDRFDPDGVARVITEPFNTDTHLFGRRVFGPRHDSWLALEDKIVIDEFWDRAGVARAPSEIVTVAEAAAAATRLAGEKGTVWAADPREGWHGGAQYTRWVVDDAGVDEAIDWFRGRAHQVRVMPFLDGIPCSIHGFVASDGVATFRPVEMLILRTPDNGFSYAGPATFWDPPDEIREEIRAVARQVAIHLAESVAYLGPFSVDGVCTAAGFRPTELNTRFSIGIGMQANAAEVPLGSVSRALIEGLITVPADVLESGIVTRADSVRVGGIGMPVDDVVEPDEMGVIFDGGHAFRVAPGMGWGDMKIGPSFHGSYLLLRLDPAQVPSGPSLAPLAAAAAKLAADEWGLDLPELTPAPDVCLR